MSERSLLGLAEGFFALLFCLCAVQASAQERDNRESHPSLGDTNAPLATTLPDAPSASQEPFGRLGWQVSVDAYGTKVWNNAKDTLCLLALP